MKLDNTDKKVLVALLRMASDQFSNHGCNDFDAREHGLTEDEIQALRQKLGEWDPSFDEESKSPYFLDWALMQYFADHPSFSQS